MYMLRNCYRVALKEVRAPWFWNQAFATEAAVLFMLFAQVSGQVPGDCL
jgi:RimJ/RimL family protein N-acetyltransferase